MKMKKESAPMKALRALALRYPEAQEGIACAGTALEKRTVKVRNKAFLFLGETDAMVKLGDSLPEATRLASREPGRCKAGASGWVTVTVRDDDSTTLELLERWVEESYRLLAPRTLVPSLPAPARPARKATAAAKKRAPGKSGKKTKKR